jgi:hypothetical protein
MDGMAEPERPRPQSAFVERVAVAGDDAMTDTAPTQGE